MMKLNEIKEKCKGVDIVTITPFKQNEDIDYEGYKKNLKFIKEKMEGKDVLITPTGSCGEFPFLSEEEHKKLIEITVKEIDGMFPVIAGTGQEGTRGAVELSKFAEEVGADGLQIILPYYFVPTEEGMYQHYKTIAEAVNIGIIIYNNPAFSKSWINPSLMLRLSKIDNIIGVKENTPHLMHYDQMLAKLSKETDMKVLCGMGEKWYSYHWLCGVAGIVSSFANFAPEIPYELYKATVDKDLDKISKIKKRVTPWFNFLGKMRKKYTPDTGVLVKPGGVIYGEGNMRFGIVKEAMNILGLNGGNVRLPLIKISKEDSEELKIVLEKMNIL